MQEPVWAHIRSSPSSAKAALVVDPNYAMARFGLGDCHASWIMLGRESPEYHGPKAQSELQTAVRLDPELADAQAALALIEGLFWWDWPAAESRFQRAIALGSPSAHFCNIHGVVLGVTGRHDEALATYRRAMELDPLGPLWNACFAQALLGVHDWSGAIRQARATLDLVPDYWMALQIGAEALVASGELDQAIVNFQRAVTASAESPYIIGLLGNALARAGRRDEALQQLFLLKTRAESGYVPALAMAFIHAGLKQREETFALMERAWDVHDPWLSQSLTINATFDPLRSDPRFQDFRRRINLPPA